MAQNNSIFVSVRKISKNSRGRANLKIDMYQVTILKSMGFTWKEMANLLGVSTRFWCPYFCNRPFCGRWCCKTSICISCCRSRWFTCTNPKKLSAFTPSSLHPLYWGTVFLTLVEKMVAGFHASTLLPCSPNL